MTKECLDKTALKTHILFIIAIMHFNNKSTRGNRASGINQVIENTIIFIKWAKNQNLNFSARRMEYTRHGLSFGFEIAVKWKMGKSRLHAHFHIKYFSIRWKNFGRWQYLSEYIQR